MSGAKTVSVLMRVALNGANSRPVAAMAKLRGACTQWDTSKGYGFILGEDSKSIFCHNAAVKREGFRALRVGELVTFRVEMHKDDGGNVRPRAVDIETLDGKQLPPLACKLSHNGRPMVEVDSRGVPTGRKIGNQKDGGGEAGLPQGPGQEFEASISVQDAET